MVFSGRPPNFLCHRFRKPIDAKATLIVESAKNQTPGWVIAFAMPLVFAANTTMATNKTSIMDHFARAAVQPFACFPDSTDWKAVSIFRNGKTMENAATIKASKISESFQRLAMIEIREGVSVNTNSFSNCIRGREIPKPKETPPIKRRIGRNLSRNSMI